MANNIETANNLLLGTGLCEFVILFSQDSDNGGGATKTEMSRRPRQHRYRPLLWHPDQLHIFGKASPARLPVIDPSAIVVRSLVRSFVRPLNPFFTSPRV